MNSKNSSLKETIYYFKLIFAQLYRLLESNTISWRLLNDPSKLSLEGVLLHSGYKSPSVTNDHAANVKESYEYMTLLLGEGDSVWKI
jgi:hypothetical protein